MNLHVFQKYCFSGLFAQQNLPFHAQFDEKCRNFATPLRKCQKHIEIYLKFKKSCAKFPEISKLEESIEYLILKNE